MSDKKARELISKLMAMLRPAVLREWGHDPEIKNDAEATLLLVENAMLEITKHLFAGRFQEAADVAQEVAPFLGSIGAQPLLDMISRVKQQALDPVRPTFVWATAWAYHEAGDLTAARQRFIRARQLAAAQGQGAVAARIAIDLGVLAYERGDFRKAKYWYEKARHEAKQAGDLHVEAIAIHNLAVRKLETDPLIARELLEKSLEMKEAAGASEDSKAGNWSNLGILFAQSGDHERAYDLFKKAVVTYRSVKDYSNLALALLNLANTDSELGRFKEAEDLYHKGLSIAKRLHDLDMEVLLHQGYAVSAAKHERYKVAVKEFRILYDLLTTMGEDYRSAVVLHDLALSMARVGDRTMARRTINEAMNRFENLRDRDWYRRCLLLIASDIEDPASEARLEALCKAASLKGGQDTVLKLTALRSLWHDLIERGMYRNASRQLHLEKLLLRDAPLQLKERLHRAGMKLLDKGRKREALRLLRQVEKLTKRGDVLEVANVRQDLAIVLAENGQFSKACDLLSRNIKLARQRKDRILLAVSLGNLGEIKNRTGLHQEAISLLMEAVRLSKELHDTEGEVLWSNNLALSLSDLDKNDEAERTLMSVLKTAVAVAMKSEVARVRGSLGNLSTKRGRFDKAEQHYTAAIEAAKKAGIKDFAVSMRFNRATAYSYDMKKDAALKDIRVVVQDAFRLGLYELARDASHSASIWAINWRRPTSAGEFAGVNFLGSLMVERVRFDDFATLLWIAYLKLSAKHYQRFYGALKRQLLHSDKSGSAWEKIKQMVKYMKTLDKNKLHMK